MTEEGAQAQTETKQEQAPAPKNSCSACGSPIPERGYFCPNCGTPLAGAPPPYAHRPMTWTGHPYAAYYQQPRTSTRAVFKAIAAVLMLSFVGVLIAEVITLIYAASIVGPDILDPVLNWAYPLFIIVPWIVQFATLSGYPLLGYYAFLIVAIVMSAGWVLLTSMRQFGKEIEVKAEPKVHSALFDVAALLFATIFFSLVVALLFKGASSAPSTGSLSRTLLALASASVWEELVSRVLLIGVPLLVIHSLIQKRKTLHRYFLGGGFKLGGPEIVLIVISGIMFGIAHYEGGWGVWKIVPAAVAGFAFGYLFLRHGLAAAIILHFGTDYLTMPGDVSNSLGIQGVLGITTLVWAGAGAVFFAYFVIRVLEFFSGTDILPGARPQAQTSSGYGSQPIPQPTAAPAPGTTVSLGGPVGHGFGGGSYFICPACGSREARWVNGRFQCLSCGRLS